MNSPSRQPVKDEAGPLATAARAAVVNRTRRVVREQALALRAQKTRSRSLWIPIALCSALVVITCYGAWGLLDTADLAANGPLDASYQMLVFLAWSLPVTILVVGLVWLQRSRSRSNGEV